MINKVLFIGSKRLGYAVLEKIHNIFPSKLFSVVTVDDSNDCRSEINRFKEFSKRADKVLHMLKKPSELLSVIEQEKPDLCLVVCWYWLLKPELLAKVQKGFLGIHGSLLPKYRGNAPLVWPIINGEKQSGLSLFYFDDGMDTGDVVGQRTFEISQHDTIKDILKKSESLAVDLIEEFYPMLMEGTAPRIAQNHREATYCSQRRAEDGHLNWMLPNFRVHNLIRAQTSPYPGVFCYRNGEKIYIWKSSLFPYPYFGIPGLVVQSVDNSVVVTCGDGAVCLHDVQVDGSRPQKVDEILKYGMRLT